MQRHDEGRSAMRALAVAAVALAGFFFSLTPLAERADGALLDHAWRTLRKFDTRPAPDDIVIVGIDEATIRAIPEPPSLWHAALGAALAKLAGARPRAIAQAFPQPERSND
jgi:adenylate cyclase